MSEDHETLEEWCHRVAGFGVDMLVDYRLLDRGKFDEATELVATEILVRLSIDDLPPLPRLSL